MYKVIREVNVKSFEKTLNELTKSGGANLIDIKYSDSESGEKFIAVLEIEDKVMLDSFTCSFAGDAVIAERAKQEFVKGFTAEHDFKTFKKGELTNAAYALAVGDLETANGFRFDVWEKLLALPYERRLAIAGAWLIAEADRHAWGERPAPIEG